MAALDEEIATTRNALAALVGAGPDRGLAIQRPQVATLRPFGLPDRLALDLIGRRPDIVAARWRAEAATHRVDEAKRAFYPDINLSASVGQAALSLDQLFKSSSTLGFGGPALSLPIFEGGRLRATLHGARSESDAAVASYDETVTEALHEVADAVAGERALSARLSESRAALAADENAHRIARLRYDGGLATYQSVLLAEDAVLLQRRIVADLESRALTLDIALIRALGGGFTA
jgi:NodT family efflux transporter outer membrane factor (OMF) lipoprotein